MFQKKKLWTKLFFLMRPIILTRYHTIPMPPGIFPSLYKLGWWHSDVQESISEKMSCEGQPDWRIRFWTSGIITNIFISGIIFFNELHLCLHIFNSRPSPKIVNLVKMWCINRRLR
jgi:hypothetical protein